MKRWLKNIFAEINSFVKRQYFVLFFMLALGVKLCLFPQLIGFNDQSAAMWFGYVFSFLFSILIFTPILFVKKGKKLSTFILGVIVAAVLSIDLIYFRFFQALPTFGILNTINQTKDIAPSIVSLLRWSDLWLFFDVVLILSFELVVLFLLKITWQGAHRQEIGRAEKIFLITLIAVLIVISSVFTFFPKPRKSLYTALSVAFETRYNIVYFGVMGSHLIDGYRFASEQFIAISASNKEEVLGWVSKNLPRRVVATPVTGQARGKRVIMVQVESLGSFVIGKRYEGQEITPNLNQFAGTSTSFTDARSVIGSGHTSDADLVSNSSLYPLFDSAAFVRYGRDDYTGLASVLGQNGYKTAAYHAYNRNFWNRSVAFGSLGFDNFFAAESYPRGATLNLPGLNDSDFFKRTAEYIKSGPEKSLSYVITLSSHYPYEINSTTSGLKLNAAELPDYVGGYLQNINYTDKALGQFLEQLKKDGLYDDSLIVVYGDHFPTMNDFTEGDLIYRNGSEDNKRVPLYIKAPNQEKGAVVANTVTTLDIMPTILDFLGIKSQAPMFGQSLFASGAAALPRCVNGEVIHSGSKEGCEAQIIYEKNISAKIIKYNLFKELYK